MSDDGFSDYLDEPNMEIQIDTLMGTSFDMRVCSTDTIREIKQRIQRVEGIPIQQQNLIFQSKELKDSRRLCDAGIRDGSTIKLVVAMKGGPISTRRLSLSCEHHLMLKELKELLENTRDEIGEDLAPGSKVSVLVFKEGDILNLLRVIENEDGSYSPYSEKTITPPNKSTRNKDSQLTVFDRLVEDTDMMTKIANLRKKMDQVNLKRQLRHAAKTLEERCFGETASSSSSSTSENTKLAYKLFTECDQLMDNIDFKIFEKSLEEEEEEEENLESEEIALKDKHRIKPGRKSFYSETQSALSLTKQNYSRIHKKAMEASGSSSSSTQKEPVKRQSVHLARLVLTDDRPKSQPDSLELEESAQDVWEIHESASERLKHSATCKLGIVKRRQSLDYDQKPIDYGPLCSANLFQQFVATPSAIPPQYAPKEDDLCDYYFKKSTRSPLYGRKTKDELAEVKTRRFLRLGGNDNDDKTEEDGKETIDELYGYGYYNLGCANNNNNNNNDELVVVDDEINKKVLPPVVIKKKSRCSECNKRLNITNIYNCRCGKIFCSQHRYSEVHRCNYDYKSEGRRILEHQNPLVTADKINRI